MEDNDSFLEKSKKFFEGMKKSILKQMEREEISKNKKQNQSYKSKDSNITDDYKENKK